MTWKGIGTIIFDLTDLEDMSNFNTLALDFKIKFKKKMSKKL